MTVSTNDSGPASPSTGSPERPPGTVRRTSSIDISRLGRRGGSTLVGAARDVVAGDSGDVVADAATVEAELAPDRGLVALDVRPERGRAAELVGARVGGGFRARAEAAFPDERATVVGQLLDDLPVAALIGGYAAVRELARRGGKSSVEEVTIPATMVDLCSGWRAGGTMMVSVDAGRGVPLQPCPPAPSLVRDDDPGGWHALSPLEAGWMRRCRRIDVAAPSATGLVVDAMFRDSYGEPDGTEVVLHEYRLSASIDPVTFTLTSLSAEPHVLPYPECPLAADHVAEVAGVAITDLPRAVKDGLRGTTSCTHLNDLLRSLAGLTALAGLTPHG